MFKITLDEQAVNNLVVFLKRANLVGEEAFEYVRIINQIQQAEKVEEETK